MFFGREDQLEALMALWNKRVPSLVTCRGRRRIGKSTLVAEFARRTGARFLKIEGLRPKEKLSNADELASFGRQLARQAGGEDTPPADWDRAFARLDEKIGVGKTVVLLDEVSWMGHYDPAFPETFKVAWDNLFKRHPRLVVVLCGSVSSWIRENIVDNGAFAGRRSLDLVVRELPLRECARFWGAAAGRTNPREILDVLSVTGGVPRYLEEIDPALSASENIHRMAFLPNGILAADFEDIFRDAFNREPGIRADILRALCDGPKNVSAVSKALGVERGGRVSSSLEQLEEAGFVASDPGLNPFTGEPVQQKRYRLSDNYARFYLRYIERSLGMIGRGAFAFASLEQLPGWETILGLAFENLVVNNFREILPRLGLDRTVLLSAAPFRGGGVQVDLLLQTRRSLYLVEVKRRREIGRGIVAEMDRKVQKIARPRGPSVRTALVYEGRLHPSIEADGGFDFVVNAEDFLS